MSLQQLGRLALRVEGENWCAYYALPSTMVGAIFLGSIRMSLVEDKDCKQAFMDLMRMALGIVLKEVVGEEPKWEAPILAPENERSGSA